MNGSVRKLDGKSPIPVSSGKRALFKKIERSALVGFLRLDGDIVPLELIRQIQNLFIPLCFEWNTRLCKCIRWGPGCEIVKVLHRHNFR